MYETNRQNCSAAHKFRTQCDNNNGFDENVNKLFIENNTQNQNRYEKNTSSDTQTPHREHVEKAKKKKQ